MKRKYRKACMVIVEKTKVNQLLLQGDKYILQYLESLGKLPDDFETSIFFDLLRNPNDKVRVATIKNIGKLANLDFLNDLFGIALNDKNTMARREATSSIGRMRNEKIIPCLIEILDDEDPKVVMQAIRGLLNFKENTLVQTALKEIALHPNEEISYILEKEFITGSQKKILKSNHVESPDFLKNAVIHSDVLDAIRLIPSDSIHLTFTSPPYYNARDYAIYNSYSEYLDFLKDVFQELHRITKEGRFFLLNTAPVIVPRLGRNFSSKRYPIPYDLHSALTEMGWEYIDDIVWLKPEASVKNRNGGFFQHRKPLAYKPNTITECVMVYRKKTTKLLDWNIKQYPQDIIEKSKVLEEYETSNVWKIDPTFDRTHSAVFPIELCNRVIKFYSYWGDLVFDPFGGSGTVGEAAKNLNRYFLLTEKEDLYIERIKERVLKNSLLDTRIPQFLSLNDLQIKAKEYHHANSSSD
jgi:DNA modification methylase